MVNLAQSAALANTITTFKHLKMVRLAPCKRFETVSFSMQFQGHETVTIRNRIRVNTA